MEDLSFSEEAESALQPLEPIEPPESKQQQTSPDLHRIMQQTLHMLQQTLAAMGTRIDQIEGIQQSQSEKLTAALDEATELAAVYREQLSQHDSHLQKLESLQTRQERTLAVLVQMSQQPAREG